MTDTELLLAGLLIGLVCLGVGALAAVVLARRSAAYGDANAGLEKLINELAGRVKQVAEEGHSSRESLTKTIEERLDKVTERMGKSLDATANKTAESLGELRNRLKVIDEAQKNLTDLSGDIVSLQDILANKQARGAFGESQLGDLVRAMLPPSAYSFQTTLSNNKRVDCLINMPNPPGPIAIDAKFPLEGYHALRAAESDEQAKAAARTFSTDILKHAGDIAEKYMIPGETADLALMFLPSEAVYAELHANYPDVVQKCFRRRVFAVSPTTLMATLNTVRAILRDVEMRRQAGLIQEEVVKLAEDVERLGKRVAKLGQHFGMAEKDIRDIQTSTRKITSKTRRIADVRLEEGTDGGGDGEALALGTTPPVAAD